MVAFYERSGTPPIELRKILTEILCLKTEGQKKYFSAPMNKSTGTKKNILN